MARTGIALGSNLGDRLANLRAACEQLAALNTPGARMLCASVYETEPQFCPQGSPRFYNSVIEMEWDSDVFSLLAETQALEKKLGRANAPVRNAPRVIDIDLLYCGDSKIESESLVLPHPGIVMRRFVLEPLAEIRPKLVLPNAEISISRLLAQLGSEEPPLLKVGELKQE